MAFRSVWQKVMGTVGTIYVAAAIVVPGLQAQDISEPTSYPEGIQITGDTTEVMALLEWTNQNKYNDGGEAERVLQRAHSLAEELDFRKGIAWSLILQGQLQPDIRDSGQYFSEAQIIFEQIGDRQGLTDNLINLGNVAKARGVLDVALTYYFEALEEYKRTGNVEGQASVLNNIAFTYHGEDNLEEAKRHYEHALAMIDTMDTSTLSVNLLMNYGFFLVEYGEFEQAEEVLLQGLATAEDAGLDIFVAGLSNNLGFLFNQKGEHGRALTYLLRAQRLLSNLHEGGLLIAVQDELAKAYLGLGEYAKAIDYAQNNLAEARQRGVPGEEMTTHLTLSGIFESSGNHAQALAHHQAYANIRDEVVTAEKAEIIAEMQTRYETEEKRREIERLEQDNQIQILRAEQWRGRMILGVSVLLLLLALLFSRYRLQQRTTRLLEELDVAKSRFFANISHEFRTPLTVILGSLQDIIAGRFDKKKEEFNEQHHVMLRNTRRLQQLIDEILDLNRLESGSLELRPESGDLVLFLQRLVEAHSPLAERRAIELTFSSSVTQDFRFFDGDKLQKIVGNLLSNALKFSPRGGSVDVSLHTGEVTEIIVSDDGPGISEEEKKNVFDRFVQMEEGVRLGGTGIGLALAKELTEFHGGSISLESEPGNGSTFTVRLPLKRAKVGDDIRYPPAGKATTGDGLPPADVQLDTGSLWRPSGEKEDRTTVLIIEDNDDVRAYLRRSLEEDYRVIEASNGEAGLKRARLELPDLIVSDVMLPGIDGFEVVRRLKGNVETDCIPVVMLTARAATEDHTQGYGSGAEIYITKPFSPEMLRAACARLLEERQRLRRRLTEQHQIQENREEPKSDPPQTSELSTLVREVLIQHLDQDSFSIDDLATALGMSRPTLYRRIKQELDTTPNALVQKLRLEYADELLRNRAGSVSEVAYAVGFKSLSHFTRSYRAHYEVVPSSVVASSSGRR